MNILEQAKDKYKVGVTFRLFTQNFLTHTIENDFDIIERRGEILLSYGYRKYTLYNNTKFAEILK